MRTQTPDGHLTRAGRALLGLMFADLDSSRNETCTRAYRCLLATSTEQSKLLRSWHDRFPILTTPKAT